MSSQLRNYLSAQQWGDADSESSSIMLKFAGRTSKGLIDYSSLPCEVLSTIDQTWKKYTNSKYAFGCCISRTGKEYTRIAIRRDKCGIPQPGSQS
ncbi:GUN4 domain-containing protein [Crinalium epipsammum]|uniref:GUN4 domain-containing protein n=1 Tax=Crinalium epipsammum TaxID=241425 RepID=UPI00090064BF